MTTLASQQLLDETDTSQRLRQNLIMLTALPLVAVALVLIPPAFADKRYWLLLVSLLCLFGALIVVRAGARVLQKWEVEYKGHRIRFENSPIFAEKLYIDDELVARGGLGLKMRLQGVIRSGEGVGDRITADVEAGFTKFRCRLSAEQAPLSAVRQ
jgi:hypothetical protein